MDISLKNYIIATIKPWNIREASIFISKNNHFHIVTDPGLLEQEIRNVEPRYIFFPHWSTKIPKNITDKYECVIFHIGDVPRGRGGTPLQNHIIRKWYNTQVTALRATEELDAGPVYMKCPIYLDGSAEEIFMRSADIIFNRMIPSIAAWEPVPIKQEGKVMIFKRLGPDAGDLGSITNMDDVYDRIRMLDAETYPKAFIQVGNLKYEFTRASRVTDGIKADVKITEVTK